MFVLDHGECVFSKLAARLIRENKHQSKGDEATWHYQRLTGEFVIGSQTLPSDDVHLRLNQDRFIGLRSKSTIKSTVRVPMLETADVGWKQSL